MAQSSGSRPHSKIQFPYNDLKDAEEVAEIVFGYPTGCTINQLAAALRQSASSGAFRNKIIGAKMFGLIDGAGQFRLTELGHRIIDESERPAARVDAFLTVPLFKALYDNAGRGGGKLPTDIKGIERWIIDCGVVPNQAPRARQTFQRSGKLAGFFDHGEDRLIPPALNHKARTDVDTVESVAVTTQEPRSVWSQTAIMQHPLIVGMLQTLPDPGSKLSSEFLNDWTGTFERNLRLIYSLPSPTEPTDQGITSRRDKEARSELD
jgi:hypothetical protein